MDTEEQKFTPIQKERLPRMRTVKKAYELLKAEDPETDITMKEIYNLIENGEIKVYCVGRKKLINADLLFAKLMCYYSPDNRVSTVMYCAKRR